MKNGLCAWLIGLCSILLVSCDKNENITADKPVLFKGTGSFTYTGYNPLKDKPIDVYFHIPNNVNDSTPILMVFHGSGRDAEYSRDVLISKSDKYNFIIVAPEFSDQYFPGGDMYNLGNIFEDGDHPSAGTLNNEDNWTFSVIDPLFDYMKLHTGNINSGYDVFGHSAGAQFAHRLLIFKPHAAINRMVAASAGWYTMPDDNVSFPYGLEKSPAENTNLAYLFASHLTVMVGEADTDPNSSALRHNSHADAQGINRLQRAQYFYNNSAQIAAEKGLPFIWKYKSLPHVDHDFEATATSAADLLYKS